MKFKQPIHPMINLTTNQISGSTSSGHCYSWNTHDSPFTRAWICYPVVVTYSGWVKLKSHCFEMPFGYVLHVYVNIARLGHEQIVILGIMTWLPLDINAPTRLINKTQVRTPIFWYLLPTKFKILFLEWAWLFHCSSLVVR